MLYNNTVKIVLSFVLLVLSIWFGVIGGIVAIIDGIKSNPTSALMILAGILRVVIGIYIAAVSFFVGVFKVMKLLWKKLFPKTTESNLTTNNPEDNK